MEIQTWRTVDFASRYVTTDAGSDAEACARIVLAAENGGWCR